MAFTASVTKQLGDLLHEQQEPFVLEIYLIDKGYPKNILLSKKSTSNPMFKRSSKSEVYRRRKIISSCSSVVKALVHKLGSFKVNRDNCSRKNADNTLLLDRRTGIESSVVTDCVFLQKGSQKYGNLVHEEQATTDIMIKKILEDRTPVTQLSPVSVLEINMSTEDSPIHNREDLETLQEASCDSINYTNSCVENSVSANTTRVNKPDTYSRYKKLKLAFQQMKQLLFACVKEIVETQRLKNTKQDQLRLPMGGEAIGKIFCENILEWSTQHVNVIFSNQLLDKDLSDLGEEWNDFEQQQKVIGMGIADHILEDISSDIVMDMISCNHKLS